MRTTIIINDSLLTEAKKLATERKSNVSEVVNEALRLLLKQTSEPLEEGRFQMPTYRPAEKALRDTKPDEMSELMVAEEIGDYKNDSL